MRYGDTAVAGEQLYAGMAITLVDGKLYATKYGDGRQHVGITSEPIDEGDTVRLDPPPGILRKVAEQTVTHTNEGADQR
jgi:hypothetical protein